VTVSVIIPTFDRASVLSNAINSVVGQSFTSLELIIVDDGSTDGTAQLVDEWLEKDARISYYRQNNQGVSSARNLGISKATGEWLAFLDSDDEWLPQKLAKQMELLDSSDHLVCHAEEIWVRNGKRVNQMKKHQKQGGDVFEKSLAMCAMSPSSIVIHKSVFDHVGYFDENFIVCEDYDLWLRIAARYEVAYIEEPMITKFGGHEDQLSRRYFGMDQYRIAAMEKILDDDSFDLAIDKRQLTQKMHLEKLDILEKGATKHQNTDLLAFCELSRLRLAKINECI